MTQLISGLLWSPHVWTPKLRNFAPRRTCVGKFERAPKILTTNYDPAKSLLINSVDSHVSKTGIALSRPAPLPL